MPRGLDGTYCRMGRGNRREVVERNKYHPLDAATATAEGGMSMIPWIYADLDTIIDSYSEAEEGE